MAVGAGKPRKTVKRPEQALQKMLLHALGFMLPRDHLLIHVPNGGRRSPTEAAIFAGLGVLKGMPDLVLFWAGRAYCMELKAGRGQLSDNQLAAHCRLRRAGIPVAVVRSLPDAIAFLRDCEIPLRLKRAES